MPILVGGTGLYIESVLREYRMLPVPEDALLRGELAGKSMEELAAMLLHLNPAIHNTTDLTGRERLVRAIEIALHTARNGSQEAIERPDIVPLVIGIRWDRSVLRERITRRLEERLGQGMIAEVQRLRDEGVSWERLDEMGLEYRYVSLYLRGELAFEEMFRRLDTRIHAGDGPALPSPAPARHRVAADGRAATHAVALPLIPRVIWPLTGPPPSAICVEPSLTSISAIALDIGPLHTSLLPLVSTR
jgi:hypothetical protein